ncbi:MAG: glycosyltransferase family 2 protein [candidate division WOR-3 bacterium]
MLPKVVIIILNYNNWRDTIKCLESVLKVRYSNFSVVLIDNGSFNDSVIKIKDWIKNRLKLKEVEREIFVAEHKINLIFESEKLVFMSTDRNLGFSGGNNIGFEYSLFHLSNVDYIFLLNNDTVIDPNCISTCLEIAQKCKADIVGALILNENGDKVIFSGARFPAELFWKYKEKIPKDIGIEYWDTDRVEGSGMLISKTVLEVRKKNFKFYFDPTLFLYGEDLELCISAKKLGFKSVIAKKAVIYHKPGSSAGGQLSPLSVYYGTRNRILLAKKFLPTWQKLLYFVLNITASLVKIILYKVTGKNLLVKAKLDGLIDGYKGIMGKWSKHEKYIHLIYKN